MGNICNRNKTHTVVPTVSEDEFLILNYFRQIAAWSTHHKMTDDERQDLFMKNIAQVLDIGLQGHQVQTDARDSFYRHEVLRFLTETLRFRSAKVSDHQTADGFLKMTLIEWQNMFKSTDEDWEQDAQKCFDFVKSLKYPPSPAEQHHIISEVD